MRPSPISHSSPPSVQHPLPNCMSRKSDAIFGRRTTPEPPTSHIGKGVALVARTAAFVYKYAKISQMAEMTLSFYATLRAQTFADRLYEGSETSK